MAILKPTSKSPYIPFKDPNIVYISDDDSNKSGVDDAGYDFENVISEVEVDDHNSTNNPDNNSDYNISLVLNDAAANDAMPNASDADGVATSDGISAVKELGGSDIGNNISVADANSGAYVRIAPDLQLIARELAILRASFFRSKAEIYYNLILGEPFATTTQVKQKRNSLTNPLSSRKRVQPPFKPAKRSKERLGYWNDVYIQQFERDSFTT
jgi:hypothetical protein